MVVTRGTKVLRPVADVVMCRLGLSCRADADAGPAPRARPAYGRNRFKAASTAAGLS